VVARQQQSTGQRPVCGDQALYITKLIIEDIVVSGFHHSSIGLNGVHFTESSNDHRETKPIAPESRQPGLTINP
jgi:hypothetical protein